MEDNNPIDYGKLAFMRVEDLESGLRIAATRPRFNCVKINTYPNADISGRQVDLGAFGAAGDVSIFAKLSVVGSGSLELRVNNMTAALAALTAGDVILLGALSVNEDNNLITLACSGVATLVSAEIIIFGEGVTCDSAGGVNYAHSGSRAVILRFRDNLIDADIFDSGVLTRRLHIGRGAAGDIIAEDGIFKAVYIDNRRNLWYAEIVGNGLANLRWLADGFDTVALIKTCGLPIAVLSDGKGALKCGRIRSRLGNLTDIEGSKGVRSFCAVKGEGRPALVLTGFDNRSVVRTAAAEDETAMGTVRGSGDCRIL